METNKLNRTIGSYIKQNEELRKIVLKKCPVCHHRFVVDHGQLTYYSHSDESQWDKVIEDTVNGKLLNATGADINRHPVTVFYMRHKSGRSKWNRPLRLHRLHKKWCLTSKLIRHHLLQILLSRSDFTA